MRTTAGAVAVLLCALLCAAPSGAQEAEQQAQLSAEERKELAEISLRIEEETRVARAELEIIQAQLKRLLLSADADLQEVEELLRKALRWELEVRLSEIRRELEIRKLIGDRRWAQYVRARQSEGASRARALIDEYVDALAVRLARISGEQREEAIERIRTAVRESMTRLLQAASQDGS